VNHHGQPPYSPNRRLELGIRGFCVNSRPRRAWVEKQKRGQQEAECWEQQESQYQHQESKWKQTETPEYQRVRNGGGFNYKNSGRFTYSSGSQLSNSSRPGFSGGFHAAGVAGGSEFLENRCQRKINADGEHAGTAGKCGQQSLRVNATPSATPEVDGRRITGFERRAGGESTHFNRSRRENRRNEHYLTTPENRSGAEEGDSLDEAFINRFGVSDFDGRCGNFGGGGRGGSGWLGEEERRGEVEGGLGRENVDIITFDSCNSPTNISCSSGNDWVDDSDFDHSFVFREGAHRGSPRHGDDGNDMPTLLGESNEGKGRQSRGPGRKSGGLRTDDKLHNDDDTTPASTKIPSSENAQQNHSEVQLTEKSPEKNHTPQQQTNTPQRHTPHESSHRISQKKNDSEKHSENKQQQPFGKKSTLSLLHNEMGHRRSFVLQETQIGDGGLAREAARRMRESAIAELRENEEANKDNSGNAITDASMSQTANDPITGMNPNMLHTSSVSHTNTVPHSFLSSNSLLKNVGSARNSIVGPGNGISGGFSGSARNSIIGSSMNLMMGSTKLSHSLGGKRPGRSSIVVGGGPGGNRSARNSVVIDATSIGGGAIGLAVAVATTRMESGAHTILAEGNAGGTNSGGGMTNGGGVNRRMSVSHNMSQGGGVGGQSSVGRRMSLMTGNNNVPGAGSSITRRMSISQGGGNSGGNNGGNSGSGNGSGTSAGGGSVGRRMSINSGASTNNNTVTRRMSISQQMSQNNTISGGPNSSVLPTNNVSSPNPNRRMSISQQQGLTSSSPDQNNTIEEDESWKLNFGINPISKQPTNPNRGPNGNSSGRGNGQYGGQNEVAKMESNTPKFNVKSVRRGSVANWKNNHRRGSIAGSALGRRMSCRRESKGDLITFWIHLKSLESLIFVFKMSTSQLK